MDSLISIKPPFERECMAATTFVSSLIRRPKTTLNLIFAEDSRLAASSVAVLDFAIQEWVRQE